MHGKLWESVCITSTFATKTKVFIDIRWLELFDTDFMNNSNKKLTKDNGMVVARPF